MRRAGTREKEKKSARSSTNSKSSAYEVKKGRARELSRRAPLHLLCSPSANLLSFLLLSPHRNPQNETKQTVMRDRITRNSRGFGFVTFANADEADAAAAASPHEVDGARVDAKESVPSEQQQQPRRDGGGEGGGEGGVMPSIAAQNRAKKVFVGGLPSATSTGKVFRFFSLVFLGRRRSKIKKSSHLFFFLYYQKKLEQKKLKQLSISRVPRVL